MASGDTLLTFRAGDNDPHDNAPAAPSTLQGATGLRPTLDFDDATDEEAVFTGALPDHYAGGGLTLTLHFTMASANTTDDIVFTAAIERIEDTVAVGSGGNDFAAANSVTHTVPNTAGEKDSFEITFTDGADMDSLAAGELFRLHVTRDANAAGDTAAGDFRLLAIVIAET